MLKKLKKCTSLALCILAIGGGSAVANADSSEMGPQPRAIYRYGSQILTGTSYLGGGEGTIFRNAKDPYFIATQEPEVTGKPCGVIYQIRNTNKGMIDAKQLGNVQRNYKVSFNATGDIKASVKNVYNTNVKQRISGELYY